MNERITKIKQYKIKQDTKAEAAEMTKLCENEALQARVRGLRPRIAELLETANACAENGIEIDAYGKSFDRSRDSYEKGTFVTNSITHRLGFVHTSKGCKILWLGIEAGGACGPLNFRTNGDTVCSIHENERHVGPPLTKHLKEFLEKFDEFEKAFYDYVDSIVGED